MRITVQLPNDLAQHPNPGRDAVEALAIEEYRSGALCCENDGYSAGTENCDMAQGGDPSH